MNPIAHECEVAVIGGGPAGAAVARLLSLWGRDLVLVTAYGDLRGTLARVPEREEFALSEDTAATGVWNLLEKVS